MASKFERLYNEAMQQVRAFQRVKDAAATEEFLRVAICVINRHGLAQEFVDELSKQKST